MMPDDAWEFRSHKEELRRLHRLDCADGMCGGCYRCMGFDPDGLDECDDDQEKEEDDAVQE